MSAQADEVRFTSSRPRLSVASRPRVRGLGLPALPSWPLVAQVVGGAGALVGVWQEWGSPVALMVGGVAAVVVGALREAGRV